MRQAASGSRIPRLGITVAVVTMVALAVALVPSVASPSRSAATINLKMVEWDILPVTTTKTRAGKVTFVVRNAGKMTHEFVVIKTPKLSGALKAPGEAEASEKGAVGEIEELKPGEVKRLTLTLTKGHYALICNLPGHYTLGQFLDFYVR
jgi:uncharacterized cupredoxin-like copper-binding protein